VYCCLLISNTVHLALESWLQQALAPWQWELQEIFCRWQLNNIGLVLHNQTWHTHHVIIVHMYLSVIYSMHSTSKSCLHFFLCNPYMSLHSSQFSNLLVSCLLCLLSSEVYTQMSFVHHFGQKYGAFSRGLYTNCHLYTILVRNKVFSVHKLSLVHHFGQK